MYIAIRELLRKREQRTLKARNPYGEGDPAETDGT